MPENAAAEGGYGLSAAEAFGGNVGNVSPSAVGGTFGGFGPDFGSAADNPAQSGRFGLGTPTPASVTGLNNFAPSTLAELAAVISALGLRGTEQQAQGLLSNDISVDSVPAIAALAQFNPEAVFGMSPPSQNPTTGGLLAGSPAPGTTPAVDTSVFSPPDLPQPSVVSPAAPAAMVAPTVASAPSMSLADQSFNPEAVFGMSPPSQNPTTGGLLAGGPTPGTAPAVDTAPAVQADPIASYGTGTSAMSVDPNAIGGNLTGIVAPTPSVTPATAPAVPGTNVSPAAIAQSMAPAVAPATAPATTPTDTYSQKGLLGKIGMDLAMGLSINPFASRESQAASLAQRGYSQADIDGYFGRTDANIAQGKIDAENSIGAGGLPYVSDQQLAMYGETLDEQKRNQFMSSTRSDKVKMYFDSMGY